MMQIRGNTQIMAGTIFDAQINASAAIATTKLADGANFFKRDGSVTATGAFNMGNFKISSLADPSLTGDATNKGYVDSLVGNGLSVKTACLYTTTGDVTLSGLGTQAGGDWSSSMTIGDRVLVKNNTLPAQNGIYIAASGAWARAADFDTSVNVLPNSFVFVGRGATLADSGWVLATDAPITVGTTALNFNQFSNAGTITPGNGLSQVGNAFNVNLDDGLEFNSNAIRVKLADSTLSRSASGIALAALTSTNILVGNASNVATAVAMSGEGTLSNTGVLTLASTVGKHADFVFSEIPTGSINGANTAFTTANTPRAGTVRVFQNGIRLLVGGGNDYTVSGSTITFVTAPLTGDNVLVDYNK